MASTPQFDISAAEGNVKDVYAGYENAVPQEDMLMREFSLDAGHKVGDKYQYGVELTRPQGHTTAANGVFPALNQPVARQIPKAELTPYQHYLRDRVTYEVLARCAESKQAAKVEIGATIEAMQESMMFRQEVFGLYGQQGLAVIGTVTAATEKITITLASWASGMWAGNENMVLTVRDSSGNFKKDVTISAVDDTNRDITLTAGGTTGLAATDILWFQGGSSTSEPVGLKTIIKNTGSLYNIDAAVYGLWKSNVVTLGGTEDLGFKRVIQLDAMIRNRGGMGEQLGLISTNVYTTLINTVESARNFGGAQYKTAEIDRGTQQLRFHSPSGSTTIKAHPMVKNGDFFSLRKGKIWRAGATDPTSTIPGKGGKVLFDLQDYPGMELRMMADNTWFCPRPAALGLVENIAFGGTVS